MVRRKKRLTALRSDVEHIASLAAQRSEKKQHESDLKEEQRIKGKQNIAAKYKHEKELERIRVSLLTEEQRRAEKAEKLSAKETKNSEDAAKKRVIAEASTNRLIEFSNQNLNSAS